ncbi:MAG: hypothetical protein ABR573_04875 [Candidatus Dormibacteria bacterium]
MQRACATTPKSDVQARDLGFMQSSILRQDAQLQRVADDLSGAVPGGNLPFDVNLAQFNARDLTDLVSRSTLCSPLKEKLLTAAKQLQTADEDLAQVASGGDVAASLETARSRFDALKSITQNPPTS